MHPAIQELWNNYLAVTPSVAQVKACLQLSNNNAFCDHIAFRTIAKPSGKINKAYTHIGIEAVATPFLAMGYTQKSTYFFKEKKLRAVHLEKEDFPRIFISEILLDEFSNELKKTLLQSFSKSISSKNILTSGRHWKVSYTTYKALAQESEYAAWLYIHGHRVNHFTISVNQLLGYSIEQLIQELKTVNIPLNTVGGIIKGHRCLGLKQASTIADTVPVSFTDCKNPIQIPSCYVEFAQRFVIQNDLFSGFIVSSADKIFESTDRDVA